MSLTMTLFVYVADFVVGRILMQILLGSGSVKIVLHRGAGLCDVTATGLERVGQIVLLPPLGMLEKDKGQNKGPLERDPLLGPSNVPPTAREPHVVPPRGPPGARVGTPPAATDSLVAPGDLLGALKLLQTVMSAEDFSKYEKMVVPPSKEERTKEREQLLWENVQFQKCARTA